MDINSLDKTLIGEIWTSPDLYANVEALCNFGSRFAGTPGERQARDFILNRFTAYGLLEAHLDPFTYVGWRRGTCQAQLVAPRKLPLPSAQSLVYSPSTPEGGLRSEVIDVGAGTKEEFAAQHAEIAGKVVLASSASSPKGQRIHRREKYGRAVAAGAVGFLFANHLPGMLAPTAARARLWSNCTSATRAPRTKPGTSWAKCREAKPAQPRKRSSSSGATTTATTSPKARWTTPQAWP